MSSLLFDTGSNKQLQGQLQTYSLGAGLKFDGVNDYVQTPVLPSITSNGQKNGEFTINVFCKFNNVSDFFCYHNYFSSSGFTRVDIHANIIYFYPIVFQLARGFISPFPIIIGKTYSFCFVKYLGSTINDFDVYIDGVLCVRGAIFSNGFTNGAYPPSTSQINAITGVSQYYRNDTYDFKIFNKALTQVEVTELFTNKGSQIPITAQSNIVADYRFNQKQGTTLIDNLGNNGTLINFANTTPSVGNAWVDDLGNSILI